MRKDIWVLLILAVVLAVAISPFASSSPDGLERVGEDQGFMDKATELISSPIPDYAFPGITNEKVSTSVAGIIGTLLTLAVAYGIGYLVRNRSDSGSEGGNQHRNVNR
ncbi:MAG: PDGLE domain-containing protein [Syntrophaceticus sp.]|jgi:cobalt/nickel transport protein|nr:PDGLE domain-containing protein [Syntrophaceticus sp.]MDD3315627.1 PDGLE domain-containing protein [Syntrophaceticus sp.]MDD4360732.1 PDGLE domain-containing protein [Syntrophaceticus sp.]MDD4783876.1 PDGLE domain-containing protein [Syntrophaceticus sp.]